MSTRPMRWPTPTRFRGAAQAGAHHMLCTVWYYYDDVNVRLVDEATNRRSQNETRTGQPVFNLY